MILIIFDSWSILCTLLLAANAIFSQGSLGDGEKFGFAVFFIIFIIVIVSLCILQAVRQALQNANNNTNNFSSSTNLEQAEVMRINHTVTSVGIK
jgi:uncharacterized membrane protein